MDLIRSSIEFLSFVGCTGSRLDQELEISVIWDVVLAAHLIRRSKIISFGFSVCTHARDIHFKVLGFRVWV